MAAQGNLLNLSEVEVVEPDAAGVGELELGQQADDGRLTGACVADECDDLARLGNKRNSMQHALAREIGEGDVLELHLALEWRAFLGGGGVRPGGRRVE